MTDNRPKAYNESWLNPATERLLSKLTNLEEVMKEIKVDHAQQHIFDTCKAYLSKARDFINRSPWTNKFPYLRSRHPHMIWELLHRVDENLILLIKEEELHCRAIDVKSAFDLNIKEEKVRKEWIGKDGEPGRFKTILEEIQQNKHIPKNRCQIRYALKLVNEQMDRTFWRLSMNTLTSVWSGVMLFMLMLISMLVQPEGALYNLGKYGLRQHFLTLVALGLMGAYLSNLMTKEDFLYVRGGPFVRYFLHNLFSKPVMCAFAAVFIFIVEKSKLIFSIIEVSANQSVPKTTATQVISLNVCEGCAGYTYAVLAIVSAFAADKVLRTMIDSVLKKLEQKAEKTKDTDNK
jgi:hypothetical protein